MTAVATDAAERPAEQARRPWMPPDAVLLGISMFCVVAATNIMTPLLPQIRDDLGISITTAGVIVGSFGLARLLVDLPAGFLASSFAPRVLSLVAVVALVVSSLIGIGADTVEILILARVVSGIGVAILATVILAALSALATPANRGKVMSMYPMANNVGIAFYPLLGGIIGALVGWRATFAVNAVLAVVAGVVLLPMLSRIDLRKPRTASRQADDQRVLYGSRRTIALAVTNGGVVANMIHRHGVRNTILPLYAATVLGLSGVSIATAIALMAITGFLVMAPGGMPRRPGRPAPGHLDRAPGDRDRRPPVPLHRGPAVLPVRRRADRLRRLLLELADRAAVRDRARRPADLGAERLPLLVRPRRADRPGPAGRSSWTPSASRRPSSWPAASSCSRRSRRGRGARPHRPGGHRSSCGCAARPDRHPDPDPWR